MIRRHVSLVTCFQLLNAVNPRHASCFQVPTHFPSSRISHPKLFQMKKIRTHLSSLNIMRVARVFALAIALVSLGACEKDKEEDKECNCGTVVDDPIRNGNYYLDVRNECSSRIRSIEVSYSDWLSKSNGDRACFSNPSSW